jgi:hypothetical protein
VESKKLNSWRYVFEYPWGIRKKVAFQSRS